VSTEAAVDTFVCPNCQEALEKPTQVDVSCDCGWRGAVYFFDPLPPEVSQAEVALSEDAVCSNHPNKKAVTICAGTGDYICDLCRVDIKGETYSIQYLDGGGQAKAQEAFANSLPRPDRVALTCLLISLVIFYTGIVLIPVALFYYSRTFKLRQTNPIYRRLVSGSRLVVIGFILSLFLVLYVIGAGFMGFAVYTLATKEGQTEFQESIEQQDGEMIETGNEDGPPEF